MLAKALVHWVELNHEAGNERPEMIVFADAVQCIVDTPQAT